MLDSRPSPCLQLVEGQRKLCVRVSVQVCICVYACVYLHVCTHLWMRACVCMCVSWCLTWPAGLEAFPEEGTSLLRQSTVR